MFFINYFLISFSIVGYGLFFSKILGLKIRNFGFLGFYGLSFLTFISYVTAPFFVHNYIFNSIILIFGLLCLMIIKKGSLDLKKNFKSHLFVFTILIIFILSAKTHDDFPYYHFPYSYLLTQMEHPIGLGHVNPGFRNASSLFFLNSLFYLPGTGIYLMQIYPVFVLGFANLILVYFIFIKNNFNKFKIINFLSLIFFSFINIFFYRIGEHGVDRSAMIIVFIIILISFVILKNINQNKNYKNNLDLFLFISILLSFLVSIKSIYLLYLPLGLIFLYYWRKNFIDIIKKFSIFYSAIFVTIYLTYNFFNSGCIIYPADFICFYDLSWSLPRRLIIHDNMWFELWSKAGAMPNFSVENKELYISGMNWFPNWMNIYFFNKVSDFLIGLAILIFIFYLTFFLKSNFKKNNMFNLNKFIFIYIFLFVIFLEWFFKHPQLRYGGYHLIALLIFLPISFYFNSSTINFYLFEKKSKLILVIVLIIFFGRNIDRLVSENQSYGYNPFINNQFYHNDKIYKYMDWIQERKNSFSKLNILGKKILVTVP